MCSDWLPVKRVHQLAMAKTWLKVLAVKGESWGLETAEIVETLTSLINAADEILTEAIHSERNVEITGKCVETFDTLSAWMKDMKNNKFKSPPMTESDFASLFLVP